MIFCSQAASYRQLNEFSAKVILGSRALVAITAIGVIGYIVIEVWSFLDSF